MSNQLLQWEIDQANIGIVLAKTHPALPLPPLYHRYHSWKLRRNSSRAMPFTPIILPLAAVIHAFNQDLRRIDGSADEAQRNQGDAVYVMEEKKARA